MRVLFALFRPLLLRLCIMYTVCAYWLRQNTLVGGGGGLEFLPGHFFFHKADGKLYFFHLRIGCISTMPCDHLFISPIFPQQYLFKKKSSPPSILMVAPLLCSNYSLQQLWWLRSLYVILYWLFPSAWDVQHFVCVWSFLGGTFLAFKRYRFDKVNHVCHFKEALIFGLGTVSAMQC